MHRCWWYQNFTINDWQTGQNPLLYYYSLLTASQQWHVEIKPNSVLIEILLYGGWILHYSNVTLEERKVNVLLVFGNFTAHKIDTIKPSNVIQYFPLMNVTSFHQLQDIGIIYSLNFFLMQKRQAFSLMILKNKVLCPTPICLTPNPCLLIVNISWVQKNYGLIPTNI